MAKMSKRKKKKINRIILLVVISLLLGALLILSPKIIKVMQLYQHAKTLAQNSTSSTFKEAKTTIIFDTYGNQLCTMKNEKDLYYVSFEDIPKTLRDAFIVMEDRDFYSHGGIDLKAIVRAVIANQKSNEIEQGASTITQQLARNIFLTQDVTWERKIEEMFLAQELEKMYSKNQILEFYLNNIYFGNGYYGVEAAARGYFNKSVSELSLSQQILISAIPNSPSRNDPLTSIDTVIRRRDLILSEMYDHDYISSMNYYTAVSEEIILEQPEIERNNSVETYARHCATESLMSSTGFVFQYNFDDDESYQRYMDLYYDAYTQSQNKLLSGGYMIYTSIDMEIQEMLQKSIDDNLAGNIEMSSEGIYKLQGAGTCIDNMTGNVVAIVGSRNQNLAGYTLNRAYQSYRQPGSSIKPLIVYMPYLQKENTPDTIVNDIPIEDGPKNADGTYSGTITLRTAVQWSRNTVAWNIYQEISPVIGSGFLLNMGFHKIWMDKQVDAAALGGFTYGVSTEEMAGAYAAIVSDGIYRRPTCIKSIIDTTGRTVINEELRTKLKIYESNACRMMTDMLKTVVERGTGTNANIKNAVVAGKTGTTNDDKDAWFCGYSHYYTSAVWIGYDLPEPMPNGGTYATSIWRDFMQELHEGLGRVDFPVYENPKSETATKESTTAAETEAATETQTIAETESTAENTTTASDTEATTVEQSTEVQTKTYPQEDWDSEMRDDPDAETSFGM